MKNIAYILLYLIGLLVLSKLGIDVEVYYASEIDKDALMVSNTHYGDRIIHLGDVRGITTQKIKEIAPIDLLIGGSPCNDLSLVNPARLGLHGITNYYYSLLVHIYIHKSFINEIIYMLDFPFT